jgi:hypothetical protein
MGEFIPCQLLPRLPLQNQALTPFGAGSICCWWLTPKSLLGNCPQLGVLPLSRLWAPIPEASHIQWYLCRASQWSLCRPISWVCLVPPLQPVSSTSAPQEAACTQISVSPCFLWNPSCTVNLNHSEISVTQQSSSHFLLALAMMFIVFCPDTPTWP